MSQQSHNNDNKDVSSGNPPELHTIDSQMWNSVEGYCVAMSLKI